jgi:hypothetical protein
MGQFDRVWAERVEALRASVALTAVSRTEVRKVYLSCGWRFR